MPGSSWNSRDAARRARVLRGETLRDIEFLQRELQELHGDLQACGSDDGERMRELLHSAGTMAGVWLDDVACRFAGTECDADQLFADAWQLLHDLPLQPSGFLTRDDAALFTTLRGSAAALLARLWITGYLLGPVPEDAWPNHELAALLLQALEHQADAHSLTAAIDQRTLYPTEADSIQAGPVTATHEPPLLDSEPDVEDLP
ncbi:hypothetical protein [Streptomyces sp. 3211]|uniref:hypothetical protein n=1 Tax=Streptomyces sp. 3211 TaxID=1964449 RepID=UPI001331744E|nr:hypothetical protein [Streptomyces sp. 3211]